jgi:hypothetical protein
MLGTYFYHGIIKKLVVGFGTLFNDINIVRTDANGNQVSTIKVPISYGPIQKFLAKIKQQPDLEAKGNITLPRLSFEIVGFSYDSTRKCAVTQTFKTVGDDNKIRKVYMPVPYNVTFDLNLMSKYNEDSLQVMEQILPFFQPALTLTIDLVESIGEKKDIPFVLDSIVFNDNYDKTNFEDTRIIVHTFRFTAKAYLFGPVVDSSDELIKKVQVDYYSSTDRVNAKRELRYTATPKALNDYNQDGLINSTDDPLVIPGDDFGFNEAIEDFTDFKTYSPSQQRDI